MTTSMPITIRPVRVPEDLPRIVDIYNAISAEPVTVERWLGWESNPPEGRIREWVVAVTPDDYVVGYAGAEHSPWSAPGQFGAYSRVDPAYRNRGVGDAQLQHVESWAVAHGATLLRCSVRDVHHESVAFAQKRGWIIDRQVFDSTLDLAAFDEAKQFPGLIDQMEADGFRFCTLAERSGEEIERKLHEVERRSVLDIPGNDAPGYPDFEQWRKELHEEDLKPDCYLFAMHGDEVAGITYMLTVPQTGAMWTQYTGVHPDYRGRKVALALKLLSVRTARRYGATYMRTNNDSKNEPMLAVNQKMGYQAATGQYRMIKRI